MIKKFREWLSSKRVKLSEYIKTLESPTKRMILRNKIVSLVSNILMYMLLFGLCFVILYPLFLQLAVALRAPSDVNNVTVLWIPGKFSLKNFEVAMIALNYFNALKNSIAVTIGFNFFSRIRFCKIEV
jgi:multiple sugar transport system permease protein